MKHDCGKPRYELISPFFLEDVARVLSFGARKYTDRNWELGLTYGRVFAAAMRHLWAWWRHEDRDPETGLSHIAHAACCLMFLSHFEQAGPRFDDRPTGRKNVDA